MSKSINFVTMVRQFIDDPMKVLDLCGGLYLCPKAADGHRLGPLVPYRGKDAKGRPYVGDIYANWAKVERWPIIAAALAERLLSKISAKAGIDITVYCGAPEGGKHLADKLAHRRWAEYAYPEKKGEDLIWGRHTISGGDIVVIVEDVSNNFTTTEKLIRLIQEAGGIPVAIATYLNRSPSVRDVYQSPSGLTLPICALVSIPYPEYEQDDPAVAEDMKSGNIVWDVKNEWERLMVAMKKESTPE